MVVILLLGRENRGRLLAVNVVELEPALVPVEDARANIECSYPGQFKLLDLNQLQRLPLL